MTHLQVYTVCLFISLLAGCATPPPLAAESSKPAAAHAAATAPLPEAVSGLSAPAGAESRPEFAGLKPFSEVIKGATRKEGFLPVWQRADRFWLEIPEAQWQSRAAPFLLSTAVSGTVGERGLYASFMGPDWLVSFRKLAGAHIQLIALNARYTASHLPLKFAVQEGFSHSLLASVPMASLPHPERKSVLIDASFVLSDLMGYSTSLERAYRLNYGLDRGNSFIDQVWLTSEQTSFEVKLHFAVPRLPAVPPHGSGAMASPPVVFPAAPDPRSLLVGMVVNLSKAPEELMRPRRADARLGHFTDEVIDLSDDRTLKPRQGFINRWRLEKQDSDAPLSPPKQPIVYWLDKNIPERYRASVAAGVLEWNQAFEKIGFKDAIVVKQQPDNAEWSTLDARHASIRWYVAADANIAVGPHHSDPRTGEILDADIAMSDVFGLAARRSMVEDSGFAPRIPMALELDRMACQYAHHASTELAFALDLLEARSDLEPDSPQVEAYAQAVVKDTITHEVGHTLGLRHNFKGSTAYTPEQLRDPAFTEKNGISASVMDYNPINLALEGERPSVLINQGIGPYDHWAIEYAYRPLDPLIEAQELEKIASRSHLPGLAYADDADAGWGASGGLDPFANRFDLGTDPLAFWQRRTQLARELWRRVQERGVRLGDDLARQRRVLLRGFARLGPAPDMMAKYVGGIQVTRTTAGASGQASAYVPLSGRQQREALTMLTQNFFQTDSFQFKPDFLARASTDFEDADRSGPVSIPTAVLQLQTAALDRLFSPGVAARLLEAPLYTPARERSQMVSLNEVYQTLQHAIWSEVTSAGAATDIPPMRRNLQREHLRRVLLRLTKPRGDMPADALSLLRMHAKVLQTQLKATINRPSLSIEAKAHLLDCHAELTEALRASVQRVL
ncbi:MAG: zinc-dependent metalloprotease [Burkholderiales bacterium]